MLEFFEADGSTPLGRLRLGEIRPGQSYTGLHGGNAYQVVLRNTGLLDMEDVAVAITQVTGFPTHLWLRIAAGATQPAEPDDWVGYGDPDLVIGTLNADEDVNIWVDMEVPLVAPAGDGQMVRLRAYGVRIPDEG